MTLLILFGLLPCVRPRGLKLELKLSSIARTATGYCGHPIATRHTLLAGPNGPAIHDSVAALDVGRNRHGARPLGLLGFFSGHSIHDCDACLRKQELAHSILCTVCGSSIPIGASVEIVPRSMAQAASHSRFRHLATTTIDRGGTVVCAACAVGRFDYRTVTLRWAGVGVMTEEDYYAMIRRLMARRQAA